MKLILVLLLGICSSLLYSQNVIRTITSQGISKTNEQVLLRELNFILGDTLTNVNAVMHEYENRLMGLGLFTWVKISLNTDTLNIKAQEKFYIWALPTWSIAQPNMNQWFAEKNFIENTAIGAVLYFKNLHGLHNQLDLGMELGFNKKLRLTYEQKPRNSENSVGIILYAEAKSISKYATGIELGKLQWENNLQNVNQYQLSQGLLYRHSLYKYMGVYLKNTWQNSNDTAQEIYAYKNGKFTWYSQAIAEYIFDSRVQKNFPTGGQLLKVNATLGYLLANEVKIVQQVSAKWNVYMPIGAKWLVNTQINALWQNRNLPLDISHNIGYGNLKMRGYEQYILRSNGLLLNKLAISRAIFNDKTVPLKLNKNLVKYSKMPISLWFSLFGEAASFINGIASNPVVLKHNVFSGGLSLSTLLYYNSLLRLDLARNMLNKNVFNVSFTNAF